MVSLLNQHDRNCFSGHFSFSLTGCETDKAWRKEGQKLASTNPRFVSRPATHIPQVLTVATLTAAAAASQKGGASTTKAPPTSGSGTDLDFKKAIHVQLQNALRLVMSQNPTASGATARVPPTQEGKTVSPLRPQSAPSTPVKMSTSSATRTPSPSKNLFPSTQSQLLTPATVTYKLAGTTKVIASSPRKVTSIGTTSQTSIATTSQAIKTKVDATATDAVSKKNKLSAIESLLCEETISPRNSPGPSKSHAKDEVPVVTPENVSPKVVQKAEISMTQEQKDESSEPGSQKVVTVTAMKLQDHTEGEKKGQLVTPKSPVEEETCSEVCSKLPTTSTASSEEIKSRKLVSPAVVGGTNNPPVEQVTFKEGATSRETMGGKFVASDASEEASKIEDVARATANDQVKVPKPSLSPSQSINSLPQQAVLHVTVNRLAKESEGNQPPVVEVRISKSNQPPSSTIIATPPPPAHEEGVDISIPKSARKRSPSPSLLSEPPPPTKKQAIAPPVEDMVTTISPPSQSTPVLSTTASTQASSTIAPPAFSTTPLQPTANEATHSPLDVSASSEMVPPLSTTTAATTTQASDAVTKTTTVAVDAPVSITAAAAPQTSNPAMVTTVSTAITTTTPASSVVKMATESPVETITSPSSQITPTAIAASAPAPTATTVSEAATVCSPVVVQTLPSLTLTTPSFSTFGTIVSSTATSTTATATSPMEALLFLSSTQTTPLISNTTTVAAQAPVAANVPGNSPLEVLLPPATSEVDGTTPSQLQGEVSTDSLIQSLCSDSTSFEEDPDVSVLASQLGIDSVDSPIFNLSGFLSFIQPDLSVLNQDEQTPQADSGKLLGDALSMCSAEFNASHGTDVEGLERQSATGVDETQVQPKFDQLVSLVQRMTTSVPVTQSSSTSSTTSLSVSDAIATVIAPSITSSQQPPSSPPAVCSSTPATIHVHPSLVPESITSAPFQPMPVQESITPASTQQVPVSVSESIIPSSVQPTLLPESMATSSLLPVPDSESITLAPIQPVSESQSVTASVPSTAIAPEDPIPTRPLLLKLCGLPTCNLNLNETPTSPLGSTPTTPQPPLTPTPHTPLGEGLLDISDIGSLMDVSEAMDGISQDVFESIEKLVNLDEQSTNATWK